MVMAKGKNKFIKAAFQEIRQSYKKKFFSPHSLLIQNIKIFGSGYPFPIEYGQDSPLRSRYGLSLLLLLEPIISLKIFQGFSSSKNP